MAAPTNSQRIDELIEATSFLNERVRALRLDLDALKDSTEEAARQGHQIEIRMTRMEMDLAYIKEKFGGADLGERLARLEEGLRHAKEKLDQRDSRRFEILKIIVGAFVVAIIGGAVGAGYQWLPKLFEAMRTHRGGPVEKP